MKMGLLAVALLMLTACSKSSDADKPDGAELYALNCAGCHDPGPGHPATMLLEEMERPVAPLIGRKDLDKDYVHSVDRKEHTSELQSLMRISYAVFCLKKKKT